MQVLYSTLINHYTPFKYLPKNNPVITPDLYFFKHARASQFTLYCSLKYVEYYFLFDENLSASLPRLLEDIFPGSAHLRDVALKGGDDREIWTYAATHGFAIATKDDDFRELSVLHGTPPKVVMIGHGNCATSEVEALLRHYRLELEKFGRDPVVSMIALP